MRKERESKEILHWERELKRPKGKPHFVYMLVILTFIYVIDEVTTLIGTQMQSEIAIGLFKDRMSVMSLVSALSLPMLAFSVFYKTLADKRGRKMFLVINTFGMGVGMFIVFLAGRVGNMPGAAMYVLAMTVINFFIPNDVQAVYLFESAPEGKRSTMFSIVKAVATVGVILIPLMRMVFMGDNVANWHLVYFVPALLAFLVALAGLFMVRESDVFINNRIRYLKMTDEERELQIQAKSKEAEAQGGVGNAFRFAFGHKQLKWLFICIVIISVGSMGTAFYPRITAVYYDTSEVTTALFMYPFASALMFALNGILNDRLGRKKTHIIIVITAFMGFILYYVCCMLHWSPVAAGTLVGLYIGAIYAGGDNVKVLMTSESAPTNLRASVTSAAMVMSMICGIIAQIIPMIVLFATRDNYNILGWMCILTAAPCLAVCLVLFSANVSDTTNVDLNTVRGDEWD